MTQNYPLCLMGRVYRGLPSLPSLASGTRVLRTEEPGPDVAQRLKRAFKCLLRSFGLLRFVEPWTWQIGGADPTLKSPLVSEMNTECGDWVSASKLVRLGVTRDDR